MADLIAVSVLPAYIQNRGTVKVQIQFFFVLRMLYLPRGAPSALDHTL